MRGPSPDRRAFRARKGSELRLEDQYTQTGAIDLCPTSYYPSMGIATVLRKDIPLVISCESQGLLGTGNLLGWNGCKLKKPLSLRSCSH